MFSSANPISQNAEPVMQYLRGDLTELEVCDSYNLSVDDFRRMKETFIRGGTRALERELMPKITLD